MADGESEMRKRGVMAEGEGEMRKKEGKGKEEKLRKARERPRYIDRCLFLTGAICQLVGPSFTLL